MYRANSSYHLISSLVRATCCLLVLVCGGSVLRSFHAVFSDNPITARNVGSQPPPNAMPALPELAMADGFWTFAGWGWELQQTVGELPEIAANQGSIVSDCPEFVGEEETHLLDALVQLGAVATVTGCLTQYELELGLAEIRVTSWTDGEKRWIAEAVLAVPSDVASKHKLLRLRRKSRAFGGEDEKPLVPMPHVAQRVMARLDEAGIVQAELFRNSPPIPSLKPALERAGYSVMQSQEHPGPHQIWLLSHQRGTFLFWQPAYDAHGMLLVSRLATDQGNRISASAVE